MSYQVIARKWRPKGFAELVGQNHVSQTLFNALKSNRLPHALLFTGPRGTGKTSTARILAKALRCPNAVEFSPCNQCNECQEISQGSSVNVMEIDGASNNGVDAIRELRDSVGYMPSSGRHKIYIIDEVHMLSTSAFNALLKTLEEPPNHVLFIMATTEVQKIPNTILSRCQRFDFRRIPLKLITQRLAEICQSDGIQADDEALWAIARQGDGSMRDSQSLLDQVITFSGNHISIKKVIDVLGLTERNLLVKTIQALVERDPFKIVEVINKIFMAGYDPKLFVKDFLEELRNLLLVKLCPSTANQVVDLPDVEIQYLQQMGQKLSSEDIHLLFDMATKGASDIGRSQDPKVVLEMLLLRMADAPSIQDLKTLIQSLEKKNLKSSRLEERPTRVQKQPSQDESVSVPPPASPPMSEHEAEPTRDHLEVKESLLSKNDAKSKLVDKALNDASQKANIDSQPSLVRPAELPLKERWHHLVDRIKKVNGLMGAQLENIFIKEIKEDLIVLGIPPKAKFLIERLQQNPFQDRLKSYISTFWGKHYNLSVENIDDQKSEQVTPRAINEQKLKDKNQKEYNMVQEHPMIKVTNQLFKTQIQSIKELS